MTPTQLLDLLKNNFESKGFYLHADKEHCLETAESLIENKARYGYMCCPCRLAKNDVKLDADIICPCKYMALDIKESGACLCVFFVSEEHKDDLDFFPEIDDRRPSELC